MTSISEAVGIAEANLAAMKRQAAPARASIDASEMPAPVQSTDLWDDEGNWNDAGTWGDPEMETN